MSCVTLSAGALIVALSL